MKTIILTACICLVALSSFGQTRQAPDRESLFGKPEPLLTAGKPFKGIMYPSPVLQDLDGDGVAELIVGDLPGRMRFAKRDASGKDTDWAALQPMKLWNGDRIDLSNW